MSNRKIGVKEAVADIRAGMDDSALMKKYNLSPQGLQSLFDKLVNAGFIDLGEMEGRLRGFWGTVVISETAIARARADATDSPRPPDRKSPPRVNAQGAARDIRLGMSDAALMEKYRLSGKGVRSLFDKLMSAGLITQDEIDRKDSGIDHTVDLREDILSLSGALRYYGVGLPPPPARANAAQALQSRPNQLVKERPKTERTVPDKKKVDSFQAVKEDAEPHGKAGYLRPIIVSLILVMLLALGFYAFYQSPIFSKISKFFVMVVWNDWESLCRAIQPL